MLIYIGIPRTGSGSVMHTMHQEGINNFNNNGLRNKTASHIRSSTEKQIWKESFKFCFVRNPYDRFISALSTCAHDRTQLWGKRKDEVGKVVVNRVKSMEEPLKFNETIFLTQSHYVDEKLDFIGRYEDYKKGWDYVIKQISKTKIPLVHQNKTPHPKRKLSKDEKAIVREYYKEDFERFGYEY
tara:strand:- start:121 stop:672 length:552 start_codon:yes stop_codon:yes gene_type:complete